MAKKVAIVQSNYIPWKGYFDMIDEVDEFILFDEMQYTKRDWRNRNRIKTPHGLKWLTIPVKVSGRYKQKINETVIAEPDWHSNHWKTLRHMYAQAPCFEEYSDQIERLYSTADFKKLSEINYHFIHGINKILDIDTEISWSSDYSVPEGKTERLVDLCRQSGASIYLSGPSAREYLDKDLFEKEDIKVEWMNYEGYKEYPQPYDGFEHGVTVLDLIFCTGKNARDYIKR